MLVSRHPLLRCLLPALLLLFAGQAARANEGYWVL